MSDNNRYNQRGVSAQKEDVHKAIAKLDKGLFPNAFCKIYPDYWGGDDEYCNLMHADGAGTKSIRIGKKQATCLSGRASLSTPLS